MSPSLLTVSVDCESNPEICHEDADCVNNGTIQCVCKDGFYGNGTICEGEMMERFYSVKLYLLQITYC